MNPPEGVLLLDKPVGPTSHDIVSRVRRSLNLKRVGHAGTLDPFASGLLLILVGQATRLAEYLLGLDKVYEARARLGIETSTHDPEGEIVSRASRLDDVTRERVEEALDRFTGEILQEPPAYSAKKVRGEAAHRRVRRGEDVHLEPSRVTIHEMALTCMEIPDLEFRVRCSSGTYVRALARDLGRTLGVGAHLTGLKRTGIGTFSLAQALTMDDLERPGEVRMRLVSPSDALAHLPFISLSANEAIRVRQGQFLPLEGSEVPVGEPLRFLLGDKLLAIGAREGDHLRPRKVFAHDESTERPE